jgi:hypothetical protein
MAVCARLFGVAVHVYERALGGFRRISCFDAPAAAPGGGARNGGGGGGAIAVLSTGRAHYDALELGDPSRWRAPAAPAAAPDAARAGAASAPRAQYAGSTRAGGVARAGGSARAGGAAHAVDAKRAGSASDSVGGAGVPARRPSRNGPLCRPGGAGAARRYRRG